MLEHVCDGHDDKAGLAVHLLLTVAHTCQPIQRSFVSYRAHAEGYLSWAADPATARAQFERAYQDRRADLTRRVRDAVAALDDPDAYAMRWLWRRLRQRVQWCPPAPEGCCEGECEEETPPDGEWCSYVTKKADGAPHRLRCHCRGG